MSDRIADLVGVGRPAIINPALVARWEKGTNENQVNLQTVYGGDERGYTDCPFLPGNNSLTPDRSRRPLTGDSFPCHERGVLAQQESHHARDVLRLLKAPQRGVGYPQLPGRLGRCAGELRLPGLFPLMHGRLDEARAHAGDPDAVLD